MIISLYITVFQEMNMGLRSRDKSDLPDSHDGVELTGLGTRAAADTLVDVDRVRLFFRSPEIAPTGHFFAQTVHPLHLSASISGTASALHCPAGHRF